MQTWDNIASKIPAPDSFSLRGSRSFVVSWRVHFILQTCRFKNVQKRTRTGFYHYQQKDIRYICRWWIHVQKSQFPSLDIMFSIVGHTSLVNHQNSPPGWGSQEFMSACPLLLLPPKWSAGHHQRPCQPHPHRHASSPAGPRTTWTLCHYAR